MEDNKWLLPSLFEYFVIWVLGHPFLVEKLVEFGDHHGIDRPRIDYAFARSLVGRREEKRAAVRLVEQVEMTAEAVTRRGKQKL